MTATLQKKSRERAFLRSDVFSALPISQSFTEIFGNHREIETSSHRRPSGLDAPARAILRDAVVRFRATAQRDDRDSDENPDTRQDRQNSKSRFEWIVRPSENVRPKRDNDYRT